MRAREWLAWSEEAQVEWVCACHVCAFDLHTWPLIASHGLASPSTLPFVARRGVQRGAAAAAAASRVSRARALLLARELACSLQPLTPSVLPRTPAPCCACSLCFLVPPPGAPGCGLGGDYERVASSYRGLLAARRLRLQRRSLACLRSCHCFVGASSFIGLLLFLSSPHDLTNVVQHAYTCTCIH